MVCVSCPVHPGYKKNCIRGKKFDVHLNWLEYHNYKKTKNKYINERKKGKNVKKMDA